MKKKTISPFKELADVKPAKKGTKRKELRHVQGFLERFGYLPEKSYKTSVLDDQTAKALYNYQRDNSKRALGTFNKATRKQMRSHRCGMPDRRSGIALVAACRWQQEQLTYKFDVGSTDINGNSDFDAIRSAFQTWEAVIPINFREVGSNDGSDILIGWRQLTDPDFDLSDTLAHADYPPGCSWISDRLPKPLHFNEPEYLWTIGAKSGAYDVESVALHEIGHILGLYHSNEVDAVMFSTILDNTVNRSLKHDDIEKVKQLYP